MIWIAAAIVYVAFLAMFPRFTIWATVATASLGAIGVGLIFYNDSRPRTLITQDKDLVTPHVRIDPKVCSQPEMPLFVGFVNKSQKTVQSVQFSLSVKEIGFSGSIGNMPYSVNDKIMAPGEGFGFCYALPSLSRAVPQEKMNFELTSKYVDFSP